jgi:hypothetical protein
MAGVIIGPRVWSLTRDECGHREYHLTTRVQMASKYEGPALALQTPGLPVAGAFWHVALDQDSFAWCRWNADVKRVLEDGQPDVFFDVTNTFSTKPISAQSCGCRTQQVEDPLLEPPKISGESKQYMEEAVYDRFGSPVTSSSHEQIRGKENEWDHNRSAVTIEMNVPTYDAVAVAEALLDHVNDAPMWGHGTRCVKLSNRKFEKQYYGTCYVYYKLSLTFDIRDETFDRDLLDEGTKVLRGHWNPSGHYVPDPIDGVDPNPDNPQDFIRAKDTNSENCRMLLNGAGMPAGVIIGSAGTQYVSTISGNAANPEKGGSLWIKITAFASPPWVSTTVYVRGDLVRGSDANVYVAETTTVAEDPTGPGNAWTKLGGSLTDRGVWVSGTKYNLADVVAIQKVTDVGNVHVEKYDEADLVGLLGLPVTL